VWGGHCGDALMRRLEPRRPRRINEEFAFVLVELLPRSSANPLETLTSSDRR
jgi:hypothetical protein